MPAELRHILSFAVVLGFGASQFDFVALHSPGDSLSEGDLGLLARRILTFDDVVAGNDQLAILDLNRGHRFDATPAPEHTTFEATIALVHPQPPRRATGDGQRPLAQEWVIYPKRRASCSNDEKEGENPMVSSNIHAALMLRLSSQRKHKRWQPANITNIKATEGVRITRSHRRDEADFPRTSWGVCSAYPR